MNTLQQVEMHGSFMWDCPHCGAENWQRSVTEFLDKNRPEDAEAIESMYGLEALNDDRMVFRMSTYPNVVKCKDCKTMFLPTSPDGGDDKDDEFDSEMEL